MKIAGELPALTGFRGVMAFWVLIHHLFAALIISHFPIENYLPSFLINFAAAGGFGVDGFFILSGFILSYVYHDKLSKNFNARSVREFLLLRLVRIYPVHFVIIMIYAALKLGGVVFIVETCGSPLHPIICDRFSLAGLIGELTLTVNWGWTIALVWNPVAWTISSEWFAYLLFPLAILAVAKIKNGFFAFFGALALSLSLLLWLSAFNNLEENGAPLAAGLSRVIFEFLAGMLMYRCFVSNIYSKINWRLVGLASAILIIAAASSAKPFIYAVYFLFVPLILSLAQDKGVVSKLLSTRIMNFLGRISYSLYLCHVLVMEVLGVIFNDPARPMSEASAMEAVGMITGITVISLVFSILLYYFVEESCRKVVKSRLIKQK